MEESNEKIPPVEIIDNESNLSGNSELSLSHDNPIIVSNENQQKSDSFGKAEFDCTLTNMDSFRLDISEGSSFLNQASDSEKAKNLSNLNTKAVSEENMELISDIGEKTTIGEENITSAGSVSIPQITIECDNDKDGSLPDLEKIDENEMADQDDAVVEILNRSRTGVEKTLIEKIKSLKTCVDDSLIGAMQGLKINIEENNETFLSCDGDINNTITDFLIKDEDVVVTTLNTSDLIDFNKTANIFVDKELEAEKELLLPSPIKELSNSTESTELNTIIEKASAENSTFTENNKTVEIIKINECDNNDKESDNTFVMPAAVKSCSEKNTDDHSDNEEFKSLEYYNNEAPHGTELKQMAKDAEIVRAKETEEPNEVFYESKEEVPTEEIVGQVCHFIPCRSLSPLLLQEAKVYECDSIRTPVKTAAAPSIANLELTESDDDELVQFGELLDEEQTGKFLKQADLKVENCKLKQQIVKLKLELLRKQERNIRQDMKYSDLIRNYEIYIQKLKLNPNLEELPVNWDVLVESENKYMQLETKMQTEREKYEKEIARIRDENRQERMEFINDLGKLGLTEDDSLEKIKAENQELVQKLKAEQIKTKTMHKYLEETCDEIYKKLSEVHEKNRLVKKQMIENEKLYKEEKMNLKEKIKSLSESAIAETNKENQMLTSNQQHQQGFKPPCAKRP